MLKWLKFACRTSSQLVTKPDSFSSEPKPQC